MELEAQEIYLQLATKKTNWLQKGAIKHKVVCNFWLIRGFGSVQFGSIVGVKSF